MLFFFCFQVSIIFTNDSWISCLNRHFWQNAKKPAASNVNVEKAELELNGMKGKNPSGSSRIKRNFNFIYLSCFAATLSCFPADLKSRSLLLLFLPFWGAPESTFVGSEMKFTGSRLKMGIFVGKSWAKAKSHVISGWLLKSLSIQLHLTRMCQPSAPSVYFDLNNCLGNE